MKGKDVLQCSIENRVALITIEKPPLNILPAEFYHELSHMVIHLIENREARAVIITGTRKAFISGLDIKDIQAIRTAEENTRFTSDIKALFRKIEILPRPVIAAIDGNCFGGGLELALSCHMRLVSRNARLGLPEINVGTIPGFGGTQRLPWLIGKAKAMEMIVTGNAITGEEAYRIGLANAVYASGELIRQATALALNIAEKNHEALEAAMMATVEGFEMGLEDGMALETKQSSGLIGSYNAKEAMAAFFERRKPVFKNEINSKSPLH